MDIFFFFFLIAFPFSKPTSRWLMLYMKSIYYDRYSFVSPIRNVRCTRRYRHTIITVTLLDSVWTLFNERLITGKKKKKKNRIKKPSGRT